MDRLKLVPSVQNIGPLVLGFIGYCTRQIVKICVVLSAFSLVHFKQTKIEVMDLASKKRGRRKSAQETGRAVTLAGKVCMARVQSLVFV